MGDGMLEQMLMVGLAQTGAAVAAVTRHCVSGRVTTYANLGYGNSTLSYLNTVLRRETQGAQGRQFDQWFARGIFWDDRAADDGGAVVPSDLTRSLRDLGFNQGVTYRLCGDVRGDVTMMHMNFIGSEIAPADREQLHLLARMLRPAATALSPEDSLGLTGRELDVLRAAACGLTNDEIANLLFISRRTVATHFEHIYTKLRTSSRAQALLFAARRGLLDDELHS